MSVPGMLHLCFYRQVIRPDEKIYPEYLFCEVSLMKKAAIFMPLAAGACWGASGIFVRTLRAADFNNITIMFSRAIVGFVLLFVFLMIHDRSLLRIRLCDLPVFLSAAINGYLLMNTCYNLTVESLTLSLASVLLGLCPIFVLLLGAVFFREKITPLKVSCMLTALCGCMLISGVFDSTSDVAWSIAGIATGLGSAFFNAIYTINSKQLTERKYDALCGSFHDYRFCLFFFLWRYVRNFIFPGAGTDHVHCPQLSVYGIHPLY